MLTVENLSFGHGDRPVLCDVGFGLERGEVLALLGCNGAGKTTLLRCLLHILRPDSGRVLLDGRDIGALDVAERARLLAYVPQFQAMAFPLTVAETVLMGRRPHMGWRSSARDREAADEAMAALRLDGLRDRPLQTLSGGQRQKVLLARALAQDTPCLLLDEPTNSLDMAHQLEFLQLVRSSATRRGLCVVIALHDLNLAQAYADRVLMLSKTRVYAWGSPDEALCAESIRAVYGIETREFRESGQRFFLPVSSSVLECV